MPDSLVRDFPLFPLGIVALPTEYVPLHIFEERYKTMIESCIEQEREFGIVWLADDELKAVGCAVTIDRVLERMDDGRLNILCRGTTPFRLVERQDDLPYPAGTIELLSDRDEPVDDALAERARASYVELVAAATDRTLEPDEVSEMTRLRDGGDRRLRPRRQAGAARPARRERAPAARRPAVPRGDEATGLRRAGPGAGEEQRQGPLRLI